MSEAGEKRSYFSLEELRTLAPRVSFPWTICALFYGDFPHLAQRLLDSLYAFTDPDAFVLRAGLNAVSPETEEVVRNRAEAHGNVTITRSAENIFKCPMMRRLFHDRPLESEWALWFDDDSHVLDPAWILDLALTMERHPDADFFGSLHYVQVGDNLEDFIQSARWYRGKPRATIDDEAKPIIVFPVGGFWAVRTSRILEIDWPDPRLTHNQTDYVMAEALRQQGVSMVQFATGLAIDDAARRSPPDVPSPKLRLDYDGS